MPGVRVDIALENVIKIVLYSLFCGQFQTFLFSKNAFSRDKLIIRFSLFVTVLHFIYGYFTSNQLNNLKDYTLTILPTVTMFCKTQNKQLRLPKAETVYVAEIKLIKIQLLHFCPFGLN